MALQCDNSGRLGYNNYLLISPHEHAHSKATRGGMPTGHEQVIIIP